MTTIAYSPVNIQASAPSVPSIPAWFGEITLLTHHLQRQGVFAAIEEQVRFARRRFGHYEVIDFLAVLLGYAVSGERTLEAFYEQVQPWASTFMALFGRDHLPARATLSRFLASFDQATVESLRTLFLKDLLARPLNKEEHLAGLWDRKASRWIVFDVDGTREAARQRALPQTPDRPSPQRRLRPICTPGYTGRKRGEVVRTHTTILQAHSHQWLGTFGNPGNGEYRAELRRAVTTIQEYVKTHALSEQQVLIRLIQCAPLNLLRPSRLRTRSPPRRLLFRGTERRKSLCPGKLATSRGKSLLSGFAQHSLMRALNELFNNTDGI